MRVLAGMIADLETSLRVTAIVPSKVTYGMTATKRAARADACLASIPEKWIPSVAVDRRHFEISKLQLNNEGQLTPVTEKTAELWHEFAESNELDPRPWDRFTPDPDRCM